MADQTDQVRRWGSTLQVYPVAGVVPRAKSVGARVVIINAGPTGFDEIADAVIQQRIGDVLPAICGEDPISGCARTVGRCRRASPCA